MLEKSHADTLASMNVLGSLCQSMGRNEEALFFYNKCLELREEMLGVKLSDKLESLSNMDDDDDSKAKSVALGAVVQTEKCTTCTCMFFIYFFIAT